jgi:VTC domain
VSEDFANPCAGTAGFTPASLESPSLFRRGTSDTPAPAAYEIKFLLTQEQARELEARLRSRLSIDPNGEATLGGAYRTTSLYTETPEFEVFRRIGEFGNTKFRVRRYGSAGPVYLERKDKTGDRVHKTRISVPTADLAVLTDQGEHRSWAGQWFHEEIARRRLAPACRISYERIAFVGTADGNAVRITFDRRVRGEPAVSWVVDPVSSTSELIPGRVICEFKYRLALPRMFKEVIETFKLHPTPCSKYRHFVAAAGLAPPDGTAAHGRAANV